jgi:hypothetical protein
MENVVLVSSGFPHTEEFHPKIFRNLDTRSQKCRQLCSRSKTLKQYRFERAPNHWPARGGHLSRAHPDCMKGAFPKVQADQRFVPTHPEAMFVVLCVPVL